MQKSRYCEGCKKIKPIDSFRNGKGGCQDCRLKDDLVWRRCLEYWNNSCAVCGTKGTKERPIERDHWFVPNCHGGEYISENIVPLCRSCNGTKTDRNWSEWLLEKLGEGAIAKTAEIQQFFDWIAFDDSPNNSEAVNRKFQIVWAEHERMTKHHIWQAFQYLEDPIWRLTDNPEQALRIQTLILREIRQLIEEKLGAPLPRFRKPKY